MGTGPLFPGYGGRGVAFNHPIPSSTEVKERVKVFIYFLSGPSGPVLERILYFVLATREITLFEAIHAASTALSGRTTYACG
jgi:hypothetical protein